MLPSFDSQLQAASAFRGELSLAICDSEYHLPKFNQAPELSSASSPTFAPNIPREMSSNNDQLKQLAACLATPTEAAETETENEIRLPSRTSRSQPSVMSSVFSIIEDSTSISAYQKIQASQRWEEWLRRLRRKKRDDLFRDLFSKIGSKRFSWGVPESI